MHLFVPLTSLAPRLRPGALQVRKRHDRGPQAHEPARGGRRGNRRARVRRREWRQRGPRRAQAEEEAAVEGELVNGYWRGLLVNGEVDS